MPHLLKKLELNGFKSFAGKTVLEFPPGITAIVGPNGSGKSNVVDAIRWLLGERDAKNLRGGRVEDLIFAGTPKHPRVGQAHAALHFENENNLFPVEFSEVVVSRRVSRDGASQYFLNKSEILLRDLIDFFAKARLGARGLIVVTQGNSDMFIRAGQAERRAMIEEMLGLREFQLKKQDAERRLRNSRINLDKVSALIEEILPHLRSLKRQTGRWERRGSLEAELAELEKKFYGVQWRKLDEGLATAAREIEEHARQADALTARRDKALAHQERIEAKEPKERQDLKEVKTRIQDLFGKRSRLEKEIGRLEVQIEQEAKTGKPTGGDSAAELSKLVGKIKVKLELLLDSEESNWRRIVNEVLEEIESATAGTAASSQFPLHASPPPRLAGQLKRVEEELKSFDRELGELREKEGAYEKGQEDFYRQFKEAVAAVEEAKRVLEKWEMDHRQKQFEKERVQIRLDELTHQIAQAGHRVEEFSQLRVALSAGENLADIERRIFKLRGELAAIGEIDEALVKEASETEKRYEYLKHQGGDLEKATEDLRGLIKDLRQKIKTEFESALVKINREFEKFFVLMFGGGQAKLKLVKSEKPKVESEEGAEEEIDAKKKKNSGDNGENEEEEEGVEIQLSLPKKRLGSLEVLSGGERSLVGIAALFALISVSPPPFLVLDEIDAPLDERNARRFAEMLREFSRETQFVIVTHNRATMEAADVLYGVTLDEDGTSKVLSLKFEETVKA